MLDTVREAISALQAETGTYPQGVQVWMKVMGLSYLASILFVLRRVGARFIFGALVLNLLGLVVGKLLFPEATRTEIGTVVHLLFWPLMLWGVWRSPEVFSFFRSRSGNSVLDWVYFAWLGWACLLLVISLLLDFRTFVGFWL